MKTLLVRTLDQWRAWLTEHHASVSEVWLIFYRQHTGAARARFPSRTHSGGIPIPRARGGPLTLPRGVKGGRYSRIRGARKDSRTSIDYKDALDEAMCFGWVDRLVKRLDDRALTRRRERSAPIASAIAAVAPAAAVSRAGGSHESSPRGGRTADGRP
jgi:hypothetical protein